MGFGGRAQDGIRRRREAKKMSSERIVGRFLLGQLRAVRPSESVTCPSCMTVLDLGEPVLVGQLPVRTPRVFQCECGERFIVAAAA